VIRNKDMRGEELAKAVEKLRAERKAEAKGKASK
jgi:hypothetical protein